MALLIHNLQITAGPRRRHMNLYFGDCAFVCEFCTTTCFVSYSWQWFEASRPPRSPKVSVLRPATNNDRNDHGKGKQYVSQARDIHSVVR